MHSGLNCHWLKVVIALEVMIFLAFCGLIFCCRKTSLSGRVFIVALSKSVHNCCVSHQTHGSGLCTRGPKSGHPASFHQLYGQKNRCIFFTFLCIEASKHELLCSILTMIMFVIYSVNF